MASFAGGIEIAKSERQLAAGHAQRRQVELFYSRACVAAPIAPQDGLLHSDAPPSLDQA
ncbi:MAG: hypothetical protein F6K28_18240 [Microcoleus sp. SIO2G3]|nr:hypothetical protein [Microcoleus sp. SIO2G3]